MSSDGKTWQKHPSNREPAPIIAAPQWNHEQDNQFYGVGQPSVYYRDGLFVMHYVDSCRGWRSPGVGDVIVRLEADNPYFEGATRHSEKIQVPGREEVTPDGAVARWAQTDIKYLGNVELLVRPAYGTGHLGLLASSDGLFQVDGNCESPADVYPQVNVSDPRGPEYKERLFPSFMTGPRGKIVVERGNVVVFYGSGKGFTSAANTWDLHRSEIPLRVLRMLFGNI